MPRATKNISQGQGGQAKGEGQVTFQKSVRSQMCVLFGLMRYLSIKNIFQTFTRFKSKGIKNNA